MRPVLTALLLLPLAACQSTPAADPLAPLVVGETWQITQIGGSPVPESADVTLLRAETGQIAGRSGCNRYSAPVEARAGKLHIGALVGTRMMCPAPQMQIEQAFHTALGRVDGVLPTADGIALQADGETVMTAVRPAG
ncbi:META domain-containing protein [Thioclava kandeliae]|uniref:META domain-containing protein n=1 Tax=Thioclava kandeliae TaxID=3070818 RepID=A0ABV1SGD3_9RHOB